MRFRLSWLVLGLLVPAVSSADDHNADYYGAFSWGGGGSSLTGVRQTFAIEIPHRLGGDFAVIPADFSVQAGDRVTQVIYMFGARWALAPEPERVPHKGLFQVLFGSVYTNDAAAGVTGKDKGVAFGLGYEFAKYESPWSVRVMYDRIGRLGDREEWFNRFSIGGAYRWH